MSILHPANKYAALVSKLLEFEPVFIKLEQDQSVEAFRTGLFREKKRQEEELLGFDIPMDDCKFSMKKIGVNSYKLEFRRLKKGFVILSEVPKVEDYQDGPTSCAEGSSTDSKDSFNRRSEESEQKESTEEKNIRANLAQA